MPTPHRAAHFKRPVSTGTTLALTKGDLHDICAVNGSTPTHQLVKYRGTLKSAFFAGDCRACPPNREDLVSIHALYRLLSLPCGRPTQQTPPGRPIESRQPEGQYTRGQNMQATSGSSLRRKQEQQESACAPCAPQHQPYPRAGRGDGG